MAFVIAIIFATGINLPHSTVASYWSMQTLGLSDWVASFKLSDQVIMALIGGTTANVIGLFLVVAHYLFPKRHKTIVKESKDSN